MDLPDSIRMLRDAIDEFGKKELMDAYRVREPAGEFPRDLVEKISQMGLMSISFPEEYGGMEMDTIATSVVGERLAYYWPSLQLIWSANVSLAGFPIMTFGTEAQKKRFLPRLATGEILGCYALTEPGAGSDAANIQTRARKYEEVGRLKKWILEGTKTFITNAGNASICVLFARVQEEDRNIIKKRYAGITAFLIEGDPGLQPLPYMSSIGPRKIEVRKIDKWGLKSSHFYEVAIECCLKEDAVLGKVGEGFNIAMETLNNGRINIAAQAVGIARRALHEAETYGTRRMAFGKPVIKFQIQAGRLKRLTRKVEKAWELTLDASRLKDSSADYRVAAAKAKLAASETAVQCAMFNYRINGGFGYTTESIALPILHDALATLTYEGTSDIQRMVIAKSLKD